MPVTSRPYHYNEDFIRVDDLLVESYRLTGQRHNWSPRRWQGWHYHNRELPEKTQDELARKIHIWLDDGDIVGVAHPEGDGEAFLEIHPAYRHLEGDMIDWAIDNLAVERDGKPRLVFPIYDFDKHRQTLLAERGFQQTHAYSYTRRRPIEGSHPDGDVPEGYVVRGMTDSQADNEGMAALLNAAFRRSSHRVEELVNFHKAPCYEFDLDIVVEGPDGHLVANCGVTYDVHSRAAEFEPVCTHPDHQRRGLARAAMVEGLKRLKSRPVDWVFIDSGSDNDAANGAYIQFGFVEADHVHTWEKSA